MTDQALDPNLCIWCGEARCITVGPGETDYAWLVSGTTPPCDHETLDGRR